MLFLSSERIKEAEEKAMRNVSSMNLIENASQALYNELKGFKSVRIYCGKGNNGSDGYATAILLRKNNIRVEIVEVMPPQSEECALLHKKAVEAEIPVVSTPDFPTEDFECILDAIFGIGIKGEITDSSAKRAINIINASSSFVVSADIPSGMNADTGEECGVCVRADKTITFTAPKKGMLENGSVDICGEIKIVEVGIGVSYNEISESTCVPITDKLVKAILPERRRYSHKGTFGTAVIVAGSNMMPGAAAMAVMAAQRSGCGIVKVIAPVSICRVLNILVKEAIVIPAAEQNGMILPALNQPALEAVASADSILIGCGLGRGNHSVLINNVITAATCPVIIDADGINALAGHLDIIKNKNVLITPHVKEFSRISGITTLEIENSRIETADSFARENGINLLLKGARSVIAYGGSNKYVSVEASSALAKAGSGDVLAGIIASLTAQGIPLTDSAAAACLIHTHAGILAEKSIGAYGATSDDLINLIPSAIKIILNV